MRRPAGVILAAIVLGFMALMGIFGSLISVAATIFMHNPAIPPIPGVRAIMVVMTGGMLCFFLFCAWTVVGLFWMRPWARYSILVIGGLEFCFSLLMCGVMVLLRASPPPMPVAATSSPVSFQVVFLGMAASYGFLSLIGAWWLVYFNLKPVRAAFAGTSPAVIEPGLGESQVLVAQPQAGMPGWRIVIVVWASLMLMSALYVPLVFLMHIPLFVFGFVLRGSAATATLLAMLAVQVWLGFGLLKKWTAAWYLAMAWQVYTVVCLASLVSPKVFAHFTAYQQELLGSWGVTVTGPNSTHMVVMNYRPFLLPSLVLWVGIVAVLTFALFQRREDYLHA
jgi:hypothetical protein